MSDAPIQANESTWCYSRGQEQARERLVRPELTELPPLSQLTLQSPVGDPVDGGGGTDGGTVF